MPLHGVIPAGETLHVRSAPPVALPKKRGIITLLNAAKLPVDGVSYIKKQAALQGFSLKF